MQISTGKNQREIKEHGNFQFPVNVSMESIQSFEQGMFLWHWHPEIELTWVMSGEMEYRVNDVTYHLKAGEGLFGNSNTLHAGNQWNGKNCSYLSITFHPRFLYGYEGSILQSGYVEKITSNESWDALLLQPQVGWQQEILERMRRIWQLSLQAGQCRMEHADVKEWFAEVDGGVGIGDAYSVEVVTQSSQTGPETVGRKDSQAAPEGVEGQDSQAVSEGAEGQDSQTAPEGAEGQDSQMTPEGAEGQDSQAASEGAEGQDSRSAPEGIEGQGSQTAPEGAGLQKSQTVLEGIEGQGSQTAPEGAGLQNSQTVSGSTEQQKNSRTAPEGVGLQNSQTVSGSTDQQKNSRTASVGDGLQNPQMALESCASARTVRRIVRVTGDITEESGGQLTFLNQKPQDYELSVLIELLEIWRSLFRYFISRPQQAGTHARNLERLREMIGFLQENSTGEVRLEDVAAQVGLCKSECCRYFKKYMNMTIFEYLLFIRVQNSLPYLRRGESITRTAGLVGFGSASYFTQIFRRYMKCSPREYKNQGAAKGTASSVNG